jgi:hypothetical protein
MRPSKFLGTFHFVPILYGERDFDAFCNVGDFVESASYGSYKTCQVRGSNPCRDRPRPPVCRAGRKTSAKRISRSEVRRVLPAAPARGAPSAHPKFVPWYSVPPILRDGRAAGVEPANFPLSHLKFSRSYEIRRCVLGENLIVGDISATTTMARVVSVAEYLFSGDDRASRGPARSPLQ